MQSSKSKTSLLKVIRLSNLRLNMWKKAWSHNYHHRNLSNLHRPPLPYHSLNQPLWFNNHLNSNSPRSWLKPNWRRKPKTSKPWLIELWRSLQSTYLRLSLMSLPRNKRSMKRWSLSPPKSNVLLRTSPMPLRSTTRVSRKDAKRSESEKFLQISDF